MESPHIARKSDEGTPAQEQVRKGGSDVIKTC
jgi:hypothetical protein